MYARFGIRWYDETHGGNGTPATGDDVFADADAVDASSSSTLPSMSFDADDAGEIGTASDESGISEREDTSRETTSIADALESALGGKSERPRGGGSGGSGVSGGGGGDGEGGEGGKGTIVHGVGATDSTSASDAEAIASLSKLPGGNDGGGDSEADGGKPICGADAMKGAKVDAFWSGYALQSCVSGRCVEGRCVCTALYTGDTCSRWGLGCRV